MLKTGEDGDGKGIIYFEDKCVTLPDCEPDTPQTWWQAKMPEVENCYVDLSIDHIGDTTISTTELEIATMFVETDGNVQIVSDQLCINLLNEVV